jgi:hypothetical protein
VHFLREEEGGKALCLHQNPFFEGSLENQPAMRALEVSLNHPPHRSKVPSSEEVSYGAQLIALAGCFPGLWMEQCSEVQRHKKSANLLSGLTVALPCQKQVHTAHIFLGGSFFPVRINRKTGACVVFAPHGTLLFFHERSECNRLWGDIKKVS